MTNTLLTAAFIVGAWAIPLFLVAVSHRVIRELLRRD